MDTYFGMRRDYKGLLICNSCWDNRHWHSSTAQGGRIVDCEGGICECPCRGLLGEIAARNRSPEPDYSQQLVLVTFEQKEVPQHQDDN